MSKKVPSVESLIAAHPRRGEIDELRAVIQKAVPELTEQVKWNAPSFGIEGDDRVTFRLQPGDRVELIFHRGVKKRADAFSFDDTTKLLDWVAADRAVIRFEDAADVKAKKPKVGKLVAAWIKATR